MKLQQPRNKFLAPLYTQSRYAALLLLCAFITLYSLTYNSVFRVDDEHILAARAQSLSLWGKFEEPQVAGNTRLQALLAFGDAATQIEPGISLIGAGLYQAGITFGTGGMQPLLTANIYVTALCVVAVFLSTRGLQCGHRAAFWGAIAFGLSSMAWPYAMTFLRDSLVMLMAGIVFLGLAMVLYQHQRPTWEGITLIALGIIGGWLSKNSMLAILPALVLGLLYEAWRRSRWKEIAIAVGLGLPLLLIIVNVVPSHGPLARFSLDYYTGLATHFLEAIQAGMLKGVAGPFFSPSKSIFLYSPVLILIPWIFKKAWHKAPAWSITAITFPFFIALAQALFYGEAWGGSFGWGLRYMLPALPGLFGLLAFVFDESSDSKSLKRVFAAFVTLGALVQLSASVTDWVYPYAQLREMGINPYDPGSAWSLRTLAIPFQLMAFLDMSQWNVAWLRTAATTPSAFFIPLSSLLMFILFALITAKSAERPSIVVRVGFAMVFALSVLMPILHTATLLAQDPYWGKDVISYQQGFTILQEGTTEQDIVLVDAYGTPLWNVMMNQWDQPNPWVSLPYEILTPGEGPEHAVSGFGIDSRYLSGSEEIGGSLWYVGSDLVPDYLARDELSWLQRQYLECQRWIYEGEISVEVRQFKQVSCK